jgi:hypothetical protein
MNALNAACKANQKFIDTHRSAIEYQETKFQDVSILWLGLQELFVTLFLVHYPGLDINRVHTQEGRIL